MIHIFGHNWPVRWGQPGQDRMVKVFSNCREVELFVNGASLGVKQRDINDYPAAGFHWLVKFNEGTNMIRAVGRQGAVTLNDEIQVGYQTAIWGTPVKLTLRQIAQTNGLVTIEARVYDQNNVPCLDAMNTVCFGLVGDGRLLDDLGTSTGSRVVQLYNGRAQISLRLSGHEAVACVASKGLPTQFIDITNNG